jgi:hypothetical protein
MEVIHSPKFSFFLTSNSGRFSPMMSKRYDPGFLPNGRFSPTKRAYCLLPNGRLSPTKRAHVEKPAAILRVARSSPTKRAYTASPNGRLGVRWRSPARHVSYQTGVQATLNASNRAAVARWRSSARRVSYQTGVQGLPSASNRAAVVRWQASPRHVSYQTGVRAPLMPRTGRRCLMASVAEARFLPNGRTRPPERSERRDSGCYGDLRRGRSPTKRVSTPTCLPVGVGV